MHCAATNNHTDIVEYIVNDLQMKELDREDKVFAYLIAQILTQLLDIFTLMATSYRSQTSDCSLCLL